MECTSYRPQQPKSHRGPSSALRPGGYYPAPGVGFPDLANRMRPAVSGSARLRLYHL
ncbi:hypothetical protein BC567DRAFT_238548, partial [Phyllosticta citribraziliensis]